MPRIHPHRLSGFTIVEIVVIIVVIAILATVAVIGFTTYTRQADAAALQVNLEVALADLGREKNDAGEYPASLDDIDNGNGMPGIDDYDYTYTANLDHFCLVGVSKTDSNVTFSITQEGVVTEGTCELEGDEGVAGPTSEACFAFNAGSGTITDYYAHENNNAGDPACPRDVIIPETIGGVSVVTIGANSFEHFDDLPSQLTAVEIPATVQVIEMYAFGYNQLTSLVIPDGVEYIYDGAFSNNLLETATFPASLVSIESYAFENNALTEVSLSSSTQTVGFGAFDGTVQINYY